MSRRHGRKLVLEVLQALRQLCIKNRPDSVLEITAWAQEHFQESLCHRNIHRCRLKLHQAEKKPHVNMIQKHCRLLWTKAHLRRTEAERETVLWADDWNLKFLLEIMNVAPSRLKRRGTNWLVLSSSCFSVYELGTYTSGKAPSVMKGIYRF